MIEPRGGEDSFMSLALRRGILLLTRKREPAHQTFAAHGREKKKPRSLPTEAQKRTLTFSFGEGAFSRTKKRHYPTWRRHSGITQTRNTYAHLSKWKRCGRKRGMPFHHGSHLKEKGTFCY